MARIHTTRPAQLSRQSVVRRCPGVPGPVRTGWIVAVLLGVFLGVFALDADAQSGDRERRRRLVEGVLRTLIDTHLERPEEPPAPEQKKPPLSSAEPASRELVEARSVLDSYSSESRELIRALQGDWARVPAVHPLIGDTAKIQLDAATLVNRSRQVRELESMTEDFRRLDRDWRVLAHRVQQTPDLSQSCQDRVRALDKHNRSLCKLFGVKPQLNRAALFRQTAALGAELQDLVEDIELELEPSPARAKLLAQCRRVEQEASDFTETVFGEAPNETIKQAYQEFRQSWSPFAASLRPLQVRYLQRSTQRIWQIDHALHDLLWIPYQVDPNRLVHLAQVLQGHIDGLYDSVSLDVLIDLPPATRVLPIASEFHGLCEYFILCAEDKESLRQLAQAYWDLDEAWPGFAACFRPAKDSGVQRALRDIEQSMAVLRESLGFRPETDWELAIQQSARLEYLAHELERALAPTFRTSGRYSANVRTRLASASNNARSFCTSCQTVHERIVARSDVEGIRRDCGQLATQWNALQRDLGAVFRQEDLDRSAAEITKALVGLQTSFGP